MHRHHLLLFFFIFQGQIEILNNLHSLLRNKKNVFLFAFLINITVSGMFGQCSWT